MGVHGLWELLSPVGRRVSVETLAGKKLAIDASIWMIQFMKAMRDERGEMVRNAHILGFFRRICKLLFLRTKPVFVFDGATPALKRRTVIARRRQRENAQAKIRKTAEKLLLNHLKAMRLKELANDLENQRQKNDDKGKRVIKEKDDIVGNFSETNPQVSESYDQEALDAMLAASIEAEEGGGLRGVASTSGAGVSVEVEDGDDDDEEEMLLPALQGKVDPAVLAALPPSMQLDLLVQMRERLMAENRQKYQKVKKAPARFSELQIQAYLKTVAFRREIDEVQKAAGGRGIGGVQTSRIASEANREFIFSSSFTGNRQSLASGVEANSDTQNQTPIKHPATGSVSTNKSNSAIESIINEPRKAFDEDVETYLDERGRVRVSKVRAMGVRMTRDLQRNLDLMKEIEQHRIDPGRNSDDKTDPSELSKNSEQIETSYQKTDGFVSSSNANQESMPINGTSIEVSFEDVDSDDDLFARIVVGEPLVSSSADKGKQSNITSSDCEWEEGAHESIQAERHVPGCSVSDESEVEWEEGPSGTPEVVSVGEDEYKKTVSKGALLEEADLQEAVRRSMEDMKCQKDIEASFASKEFNNDHNSTATFANFMPECLEKGRAASSKGVLAPNVAEVHDGVENVDEMRINNASNSPKTQLETSTSKDPDFIEPQMEKSCESFLKHHPELSKKDASNDRNSQGETGNMDVVNPTEDNGIQLSHEMHDDDSGGHKSNSPNFVTPDVALADAQQREFKAQMIDHVTETLESEETDFKESRTDVNDVQKVADERDSNSFYKELEDPVDKFSLADMSNEQVEFAKANLEDEMVNLTNERTDLGDEQRRLERNAESVSGEMFAECQELLQMFGLPYIIAPMEAEAQCAYMELENLVDGVVTDDSDVFLFGARSVYKNIFDDRKYVETYFMKDIETELGLTREKLIRMAMLLGSDYTEGISGIGIVNAVEVLNAFPEEDGLRKFREWIESPDPTILGKVENQSGSSTRKRGANGNGNGASITSQGVLKSDDEIQGMKQIFMDKHRNVSKNWHIPSTFPSDAVVSAYVSPQVDKSTEPFSWGKPDLFVLRKLCSEKFGWGTQKADELLQPVLKEYNKHETQLRLEAFYTFNERFAKIRSKRISKAVKGITGSKTSELIDDTTELDASNGKKRRKAKHMEGKDVIAEERLNAIDGSNPTGEPETPTRKRKDRSSVGGRSRGRGRGQSIGRGKGKKKHDLELSGTSSDDGNNGDDALELHTDQREVRRSKRVKKSVKYTNDEEFETIEPTRRENHDNVEYSTVKETLVPASAMGADGTHGPEFGTPEPRPSDDVKVGSGFGSGEAEPDPVTGQKDILTPEPEYLKVGGGFCLDDEEEQRETGNDGFTPPRTSLDETMVSSVHAGQKDWCRNEVLVPKAEYLKMGGVFCLDDDEERKEQGNDAFSPPRRSDDENGKTDPVVSSVPESDGKDETGTKPASFLAAIPNLRRKRRKI